MKNSITTAEELQNHIRLIKKRNRLLEDNIRLRFRNSIEGLKPMNLIKNSFSSNHGTRRNLISTTVGLGLGYLAYRMVAGKSPGMVKKTTARALQVGVTSFLAKKLGLWGKFAQNLLAKRRNRADAFVN